MIYLTGISVPGHNEGDTETCPVHLKTTFTIGGTLKTSKAFRANKGKNWVLGLICLHSVLRSQLFWLAVLTAFHPRITKALILPVLSSAFKSSFHPSRAFWSVTIAESALPVVSPQCVRREGFQRRTSRRVRKGVPRAWHDTLWKRTLKKYKLRRAMTEPAMTEEMGMSEEHAVNFKGMFHGKILKVWEKR